MGTPFRAARQVVEAPLRRWDKTAQSPRRLKLLGARRAPFQKDDSTASNLPRINATCQITIDREDLRR